MSQVIAVEKTLYSFFEGITFWNALVALFHIVKKRNGQLDTNCVSTAA
jgi:hypothetical protein